MTGDSGGSDEKDLSRQVEAAGEAIGRDAAAARAADVPVRRRPVALIVAASALAVALVVQGDELLQPRLDEELAQRGLQELLAAVGADIQARLDSTGTLPATLDDFGVGPFDLHYEVDEAAFRLFAISPSGDTVRYEAPSGATTVSKELR